MTYQYRQVSATAVTLTGLDSWYLSTNSPAVYTVYWFAVKRPSLDLLMAKAVKKHRKKVLALIADNNSLLASLSMRP